MEAGPELSSHLPDNGRQNVQNRVQDTVQARAERLTGTRDGGYRVRWQGPGYIAQMGTGAMRSRAGTQRAKRGW